ncbi:MAG: hypothetical protein Kow006_03500 [Gammaproteobacteria bacterium]
MRSPGQRLRSWLAFKAILLIGGVIAALILEQRYGVSQALDTAQIHRWLEGAGMASPLLFMGLMAAAVIFSPLPSVPLDVVAGSFFGPVLGTLYASVGALLGAQAAFLLARFLGRALIERFLSGHIQFCTACSDQLLTRLVFFSRLIPVISFDVVSYGAGLTKMSLWRFSLATYLGMLPLTLLYVSFGSVVLESQRLAWLLGIVFVALFFLLPRWIEKNNFLSLRRRFHHLSEVTQGSVELPVLDRMLRRRRPHS